VGGKVSLSDAVVQWQVGRGDQIAGPRPELGGDVAAKALFMHKEQGTRDC